MIEPKKVLIYGRISIPNKNELLPYQIDLLTEYAHKNNCAIIGTTPTLYSGKSLESRWMKYLIKCVVAEYWDCILVYSKNRLLTNTKRLEKFALILRCIMFLSSRSSNGR